MRTSEIITFCYLRSQRIELLRGCLRSGFSRCQLSLANGMHDFHPRNRTPRCPKRLKPQHGTSEPFHGAMILFDNIIEILGVSEEDGGLVPLVVALNCCRVAATLIDRDFLRHSLRTNGLA